MKIRLKDRYLLRFSRAQGAKLSSRGCRPFLRLRNLLQQCRTEVSFKIRTSTWKLHLGILSAAGPQCPHRTGEPMRRRTAPLSIRALVGPIVQLRLDPRNPRQHSPAPSPRHDPYTDRTKYRELCFQRFPVLIDSGNKFLPPWQVFLAPRSGNCGPTSRSITSGTLTRSRHRRPSISRQKRLSNRELIQWNDPPLLGEIRAAEARSLSSEIVGALDLDFISSGDGFLVRRHRSQH